jgi:hypothetical protein
MLEKKQYAMITNPLWRAAMKITYKINFVCHKDLNSKENIDFEFVQECSHVPQRGFYLGGIYCALSNSYYEVTTDEAVVYGACFFPRNRVEDFDGNVDHEEAQQVAFDLISHLVDKYGLQGTYTVRK